jgi:hypothetical protein
METLPQLTFLLICEYLDSTAIFKLLQINKLARTRQSFGEKDAWKPFLGFFGLGNVQESMKRNIIKQEQPQRPLLHQNSHH